MAYINKEKTEEAIRKYADQKYSNGEQIEYVNGILKSISVINEQPTADVEEVKHGYWATDEEDIYWGNSLKRKHCSVCKARPFFDKEKREFILTDYCSDCGAKMDGGGN